jgi:hypothetical protein
MEFNILCTVPLENFVFKYFIISCPVLTNFVIYGSYKCVLFKCYISLRKSFGLTFREYKKVALKAVAM